MFSHSEILSAFHNQDFFLEYMPTIRLADNRCVGAEALVRWRRGDRIVQPMEFIPFIENTSLIGPLTYRVVELVGKELGGWLRMHDDAHIAINVSPQLIGRGGIRYAAVTAGMTDLLEKLVFEITERGIPDSLSLAAIRECKELGARIALDDVNANEDNLIALMHIRSDFVKFDKSFVDQLSETSWSDEKMAGIAALIHIGNFGVIIEGVETAEQIEILKNAGVQFAQGWYFSHPLSASDFIEYFSAHQH